MGEALEIAKVLVDPVMKLLDMVGNAAGTMYEPHHIRKMADAEAYKIKAVGNAVGEIAMLPASYDNGSIAVNSTDTDDLLKRAEMRERLQKIREQQNIENVIGYAQQELLGMDPIPDTPVDDDWINRLLNNAKEVSSETMQFIWGKILAGEVAAPGSFSKRTLDTIRNLSQSEAQAFQAVAPLVFHAERDSFITANHDILKSYGVRYEDCMLLDECGLLVQSMGVSINFVMAKGDPGYLHTKTLSAVIEAKSEVENTYSLSIYSLTRAGRELYRILDIGSNDGYFRSVMSDFSDEYHNELVISVSEITADN